MVDYSTIQLQFDNLIKSQGDFYMIKISNWIYRLGEIYSRFFDLCTFTYTKQELYNLINNEYTNYKKKFALFYNEKDNFKKSNNIEKENKILQLEKLFYEINDTYTKIINNLEMICGFNPKFKPFVFNEYGHPGFFYSIKNEKSMN